MVAGRARRSWRQRAAFGVLTALLATGPLLALGPGPAQAASKSWESKRTEEFTGSSVPGGCEAFKGRYSGGKSAWSSKDVDVDDNLLNLKIEKRRTDGRAWTTGGLGCWNWAQKYGKFEVRAKIPKGKGIDSYFGLWPQDQKAGEGAWTGVELLAPGAETAYITNGYGKKAETARVAGDYSDAYHTYQIEWAPKYLRITMDGNELFFSTRSFTGKRWPGFVVSNGDKLTGVPDASTKLPASFQIDRVKVFTYTGVQPTLRSESTLSNRPRVDGTPTTIPTVPVTGAGAGKAPDVTPPPVASAEPVADTASPALAGGVWPWLLGGSLIAAAAIGLLEYPRHRAAKKQRAADNQRYPTGAGRR